MKKTYLTKMGVRVYCEYLLNGKPPIVLIHGLFASLHTYHRLIPKLKEHFSILALDLPGFGRSEKSVRFIYSYKQYAKLILACMDHFQMDKAIIAGHSMGGQIALNIAVQEPNKVAKLILLASSGYLPKAKRGLIYATYLPFFHHVAKFVYRKQTVMENLQTVLYNHSFITEKLIEEYERPIKDKNFYKGMIRLLRYREGDFSSNELQQVTQPVLILWGKNDRVISPKIGWRLANDLPNSRFITFEKTGHLLTEERADKLFKEIMDFVSE